MAQPDVARERDVMILFLCGDVMTGRGIDQILPSPGEPRLFEPAVGSALEYLELAERASGRIPRPVGYDYVWGDALPVLQRMQPCGRIVNLETAVTTSGAACPDKGIHYRMHPANVRCLSAAAIDCCVLANNHVLDWGRAGLEETLSVLHGESIGTAGAGPDDRSAASPAIIKTGAGGRILVYGFAVSSSGAPREWRATAESPGINWLESLSRRNAERIGERIAAERRPADIVIASIHWGGNWGYGVSREEREFAHRLLDCGSVDVVHGHSSHHPKGMEVYRRKLILYGCGDFLNDYEGIGGYESFHPELVLMYFPGLDGANGDLLELTLVPMRIRRFRIEHGPADALQWLAGTLDRECRRWGGRVRRQADETLALDWGA
ncbi:MAG TPA: CapA family protein [Steroidobacteraceae bacterium]|nr:CapA family protein [Steroidobacteraceae bacterium]